MFLPPTALAGLPCLDVPAHDLIDPQAVAVRLAAAVPPPDLRIGMNPARGMVAVPTWFWVDGYDGGTIGDSQTELQQTEHCHFEVVRGPDGLPVLDANGKPETKRVCEIDSSTFVVSVRLSPSQFTWDFGDHHGQAFACIGQGDCGDALGQPYVDVAHPSPVQHPYGWSSLGVQGGLDAYRVELAITFAAEYLVSVDGRTLGGGWQALRPRTLTWTANHQVQEAQAVLTRPCPVMVAHC
jgi:hypothetical protein